MGDLYRLKQPIPRSVGITTMLQQMREEVLADGYDRAAMFMRMAADAMASEDERRQEKACR